MIVTPDAPHELDGQLHGHLEPRAQIDARARPDAASVIRIHTGGFAEHARHKLGILDPAGLADFDLAGHER